MSRKHEVDLETESIQLDDAWLTSDALSERITQAIAGKNFGGVGRLGDALEQLAQAVAGARTLTLRFSAEHYARLEAAGLRLGKPAEVFARDLLVQVLSGQAPQQAAPAVVAPMAAPPVLLAPPVMAPPPVAAPPAATSDVSPEEAAAALTITPKRRESPPPAAMAPPVMTPTAPVGPAPSVVVDLSSDDKGKPAGGPGGDQRRWFNRS